MLRLTRALVRRPGLTPHQFRHHLARYRDALVALPAARGKLLRQAAGASVPVPGMPHVYDGALDLWFGDESAMRALLDDPAYRALAARHEPRLFARSVDSLSTDKPPVIDGAMTPHGRKRLLRFTALLARNPKLTQQEFAEHHHLRHAPVFAALPVVRKHLRRYTVAHRAGEGAADGITDFWFDGARGLFALLTDTEYHRKIGPDEQYMLDLPRCAVILSKPV